VRWLLRPARVRRVLAASLALLGSAAWLVAATPASAAGVSVLDVSGSGVSAYGGWAAWTHVDANDETQLMLRSPAGAIAPAAIAPSNGPFEVALGPHAGGGVTAVYVRCSEPEGSLGCSIYELPLGVTGATERQLDVPGGGSDTLPAIWKNRVAFVRENAPGGEHPDDIYVWTIGGGQPSVAKLEASRGSREAAGGGWPKGLTGVVTALTIGPRQLAYVTAVEHGDFGETTLWYEPLGGRPQLIDQRTSGAGNVCAPEFLSPLIAGGWLYAYLHACDPSADVGLDRLTRYRRGEAERARYTFIHYGDDELSSVVVDGAGVDWDDEGVKRLSSVRWRRIPLPVPETFCTRSDPFC
jgi:hypothetical protein